MLYLFFIVIILTVYVEAIYRLSWFEWLVSHPFKVISNMMFYMGLIGILNQHISLTASVIVVIVIGLALGYGNKYKYMFRGDNLYPWDLKLCKESSNMRSFLGFKLIIVDVLFAAIILLISILMVKDVTLSENQSMIFVLIHFILIEIAL